MKKYHDNESVNQLLNELLDLKYKKDNISKQKRKEIRTSLRNYGILSLPFSMNIKR